MGTLRAMGTLRQGHASFLPHVRFFGMVYTVCCGLDLIMEYIGLNYVGKPLV